jgi:hypothetical protein
MHLPVLTLAFALVAAPPSVDELDQAYNALKEATTNKDVAQVKKLAGEVSAMARQVISAPSADATTVNHAKEVDVFADYALYATALQGPPETTVELFAALEAQDPKSKYWDGGYQAYFYALNQTGAGAKIPGIAEAALKNLPTNADCLSFLANQAFSAKQPDRAAAYADRIIASLPKATRPDFVAAAEWDKKKNAMLGGAYYISGLAKAAKNLYIPADQALRAALPLIKGNDQMMAAALFNLGLVDYQLGKMTMNKGLVLDGMKFSQQCAAIKSELAQQAWTNANAMKVEADKMR